MKTFLKICLLSCFMSLDVATNRIFSLNEDWICNVKRSCLDCLLLSQCSWCQSENRCFSRKLPAYEDFCRDNSTEYQNHGLSFLDNAKCACADGILEENCYPPGVTSGQKCSGRGSCLCGRCVCNPMPDPQHPTKMVVGEFCEFDNFSCDGPRCNEGPYHYSRDESNNMVIPKATASED